MPVLRREPLPPSSSQVTNFPHLVSVIFFQFWGFRGGEGGRVMFMGFTYLGYQRANANNVHIVSEITCVMLGANTIAMLRVFILLRCSSWTTSAMRLIAQSSRAASVGGRSLTSAMLSSSNWHCMTCSGESVSNTPLGSSLNQAC